jgi:hypothetical protein
MIEIELRQPSDSKRETSHSVVVECGSKDDPLSADPFAEWKPSKAEWLMISCFMIVSLVVALDATILVPILPVGCSDIPGI